MAAASGFNIWIREYWWSVIEPRSLFFEIILVQHTQNTYRSSNSSIQYRECYGKEKETLVLSLRLRKFWLYWCNTP